MVQTLLVNSLLLVTVVKADGGSDHTHDVAADAMSLLGGLAVLAVVCGIFYLVMNRKKK